LNDWEERQLAAIERELRSDKELGRVLAPPTRHERRWLAFRRRFYPVGYLFCALTYMAAALGSSQRNTLVAAYLVGIAFWLVIEIRVLSCKDLPLNGRKGLSST